MISNQLPSLDFGLGDSADMLRDSVMRFADDELKREVLPRIAAGEALCSLGYTEPASGSDVAAAQCRALRDGVPSSDRNPVSGTSTGMRSSVAAAGAASAALNSAVAATRDTLAGNSLDIVSLPDDGPDGRDWRLFGAFTAVTTPSAGMTRFRFVGVISVPCRAGDTPASRYCRDLGPAAGASQAAGFARCASRST